MADRGATGAVEGLEAVWGSLVELGRTLDDEEFARATACPGWTVKDQFSHVIGMELLLEGDGAPELESPPGPHVRNELGALNERFVAARRGLSGAEVVAELAELAERRLASLAHLEDEAIGAMGPSPAGVVPYVDYVSVRTVDAWLHEQDVRRSVGRPGGRGGLAERMTLDRLEASLPFVLARRVGAAAGTTVRLDVVGGLGRTVQLRVEADANDTTRAVATSVIEGRPSASLRLDEDTFERRASGRLSAEAAREDRHTEVAGDPALVAKLLQHMVVVA